MNGRRVEIGDAEMEVDKDEQLLTRFERYIFIFQIDHQTEMIRRRRHHLTVNDDIR